MFHAYIIASARNGALYTGHTDALAKRMAEHKDGRYEGWAKEHGCRYLVWAQEFETRDAAFKRERQIKEWNRAWKLELIETDNPAWVDISRFARWPLKAGDVQVQAADYAPNKYDDV